MRAAIMHPGRPGACVHVRLGVLRRRDRGLPHITVAPASAPRDNRSRMKPVDMRRHQIQVRDGRLEEWSGGAISISIPLGEVRRVRVISGLTSERPLVQALLGAALTVLGVVCLVRLARWGFGTGRIVDIEALMVGWLIGGPWILAGALRRGLVLLVETADTTRRLAIGRGATGDDVRALADDLRARHGLNVDPL
jgi:hypothetical protein